jgi:hypothetical protein
MNATTLVPLTQLYKQVIDCERILFEIDKQTHPDSIHKVTGVEFRDLIHSQYLMLNQMEQPIKEHDQLLNNLAYRTQEQYTILMNITLARQTIYKYLELLEHRLSQHL